MRLTDELRAKLEEASGRFFGFVDKSPGCWLWTGNFVRSRNNRERYGRFSLKGRYVLAHRFSWMLAHGMEIPAGHVVMHNCDTGLCVRPEHLRMASQWENVEDMFLKRRNHKKKLSMESATEIRRLRREQHLKIADIASKFGVDESMVFRVLRGDSWTWKVA